MKKVIRLTESDLIRLVKKVINEQSNNCFKNMKYEEPYLHLPEYYIDEKTDGNYLYYKNYDSNDWNSGSGRFLPKNNQSGMEKTFVWTCNGNEINIKNMSKFKRIMPS